MESAGSKQRRKTVQCWISDLKAFKETEKGSYEDLTFSIVGVVVGMLAPPILEDSRRPVSYHLDDGTGVIRVVHFLQKRIQRQNDAGTSAFLMADKHRGPEGDVLGAIEMLRRSREPLAVGSCLEARGRIQFFRGESELSAYNVREVKEPQLEIDRMILVDRLRQDIDPTELFAVKRRDLRRL